MSGIMMQNSFLLVHWESKYRHYKNRWIKENNTIKIDNKIITGNDIIHLLNNQQQKIRELNERIATLQKIVNNYIVK